MQSSVRGCGRAAVLVLGLLLAAVGCGNDNSAENLALTDAEADTSVEGTVDITGSSTVEPLSTLTAEAFGAQNPDVAISVEGPGTGDGFARFCEGGADITGASRPIKAEELEACAAAGVEVIELPVGLDGISLVVPLESPIECLSFADLYALAGPEAEGVERWTEAAPLAEELGSSTEMPDLPLFLTGPGEESGTYDSFVEQVLAPIAEVRVEEGAISEEQAEATRSDYSSSANDNTIIGSVAADPGGLGWVGFAFADQSRDVRRVGVSEEPDGTCVVPSTGTIQDGSYPIVRTLYIYVSAEAAERPEVAAVVDFYLSALDDLVVEVDQTPLADPAPTVEVWRQRETGTRAEG
jgi:phosphate transport system substrate-binding protein